MLQNHRILQFQNRIIRAADASELIAYDTETEIRHPLGIESRKAGDPLHITVTAAALFPDTGYPDLPAGLPLCHA